MKFHAMRTAAANDPNKLLLKTTAQGTEVKKLIIHVQIYNIPVSNFLSIPTSTNVTKMD